eukprot:CAMPEP_0184857176 /NCGR_PEP_ID=MMETSP0580-20130426/2341_1 /TAXON_ID=1118495 /ORGANISM="Dactyliosolen fragilissimus" /LENGTH=355 /DNA_ID=CAMNT_0027352625 /DNA_START=51 /DNA_END=1118 /DNA_ORIENTATION=-
MSQSMDFTRTGIPKIGAVVRGKSPVTCISYHSDGVHLYVTSEGDGRMRLVDCKRGVSDAPALKFETEGVKLVESTHHNQCVLYTGRGGSTSHSVNYLSLYDNKILRHFKGHMAEVTDVSMNPVDDCFLTASEDRTVRLWNVQQSGALATMNLPKSTSATGNMTLDPFGLPHVTYDTTGLVFGVTAPMANSGGHLIHLYDARKYDGGAFAELKLETSAIQKALEVKGISPNIANVLSKAGWKSIQFNASGKNLLITAEKGLALMLDGFDGSVSNVFVAEGPNANTSPTLAISACFTPDERAVLGGNEDGTISCWDAKTGVLLRKLDGHVGPVGCVAANPKFAQIASSCTNTALWLW